MRLTAYLKRSTAQMAHTGRKRIVSQIGNRHIILMDSISYISAADAGHILISGSHGGLAAGQYALEHPPYLVIFNDAGVGKDRAGVVALDQLETAGIAAAAIYHTSGRIGEADDGWEHGIVSHANALARSLGIQPECVLKTCILEHLKV